jgi:hypothetical protein
MWDSPKLWMAKRYSLRPVKPVLTEIEQCLLEITNGDLSYREAQEEYGIPKSTLQRYMQNGSSSSQKTHGGISRNTLVGS